MIGASKSFIGLDIGSHSVKAVELFKVKNRLRVTGFGSMELPGEANRAEAIAELFRLSDFQSKNVVTAVSGKSVIFRYVNVVKMTLDELRNAIRFEAEKYFPFDISEMELDCQILGDVPPSKEGGATEMKVLLVGVKKSLVEDQAQMLLDIGLQPTVIDVDAFAIGNAFELHESLDPSVDPSKATALLDLGANKTSINILFGGTSQFAREIYIGGGDLTNAIARHFSLETQAAEDLKRNPKDEEETARVCKSIAAVLDELTNEVKLSFDFFEQQSDQSVEDVYLSGGGALAPYLEKEIERCVERKAHSWNPFGGLEVDDTRVKREELEALAPTFTVAVGLATRLAVKERKR